MSRKLLFNTDGVAVVRAGLTAADAGTWVPVHAQQEDQFDGREWDTVKVTPVFRNSGGAVVDGTSIDITPLIEVPVEGGPVWRELAAIASLTDDGAVGEIPFHGHIGAVRLDAVVLGTADKVDIVLTGGTRVPRVNT